MSQSEVVQKLKQIEQLVAECISALGAATPGSGRRKTQSVTKFSKPTSWDFEMNERAFIKIHNQGLSGPKKFVLLLAYLAKGGIGTAIDLKEIQRHWNKMKAPHLLGGEFNRFYSSVAKDNGWVDAKKKGTYVLTKGWQRAIRG